MNVRLRMYQVLLFKFGRRLGLFIIVFEQIIADTSRAVFPPTTTRIKRSIVRLQFRKGLRKGQ